MVLKTAVLEELRLSCAIVLAREEVVPGFRVMTLEGDWTVFVPLPEDVRERERRMPLVSGFMAWKLATSFILSSELTEPDGMLSAFVGRDVMCAWRSIIRKPLGVGAIEWLPRSSVGDEVVALLPRGRVVLDREAEAALVRTFGVGGEFEVSRS